MLKVIILKVKKLLLYIIDLLYLWKRVLIMYWLSYDEFFFIYFDNGY